MQNFNGTGIRFLTPSTKLGETKREFLRLTDKHQPLTNMKNRSLFKVCTLLLLMVSLFSQCKNEETNNIANFESTLIPSIQVESELRSYNLKERMDHYKVPGVQIAIVENGQMVWNKSYGISRVDDSIAVDNQTLFQAGSISKSLTAFTVLKLAEKGILDLDTDVNTYFKDWKLPESRFTKDTIITLRMLLSHTSGMNNSNHPGFRQRSKHPTLNELLNGYERYKKVDFDTLPNAVYKYSNTGYAVIQKVIEDATNDSFNSITRNEIFEPLQMNQSFFYPIEYDDEETDIRFAYNRQGKLIEGYWFNAATLTSGGLWTTAEDLAKFLIAFQEILDANSGLISQENAQSMIIRVKANYGLGFDLKKENDSLVFYHTGKNKGFTNIIMASKTGKNAVVVLTNGDNGGYLFSEIIRGISTLKNWDFLQPKMLKTVAVSTGILKSYEGTYRLVLGDETYTLKIELNGKHLQLIDLDENNKTYPLRALSETKFRDIDDGEKVDFIKGENNEIILLWDEEYNFKKIE